VSMSFSGIRETIGMIFRRLKNHVQTENWFAVFINFLIVAAGVFIGLQLGNWNAARADRTAYKQALERFAAETKTNLETLDELDSGIAEYLKSASEAFDTLQSCVDNPENREIVNSGITRITGTYGLNLRSGALHELTSSPRLLARQSPEERARLTEVQYYFDLIRREAEFVETLPLEERLQNNPIISVGPPIYRTVTYQGADFSRTQRPLMLNVPINEACRNDHLVKSFYTWERWQQVLPALSRQIRNELTATQETFDLNR